MTASDKTHRVMNYTIEMSNEEGERLIAGLRKNNVYGDGEALQVIQEVVSDGRLTMLPTVFRPGGVFYGESDGYREVIIVPEINA